MQAKLIDQSVSNSTLNSIKKMQDFAISADLEHQVISSSINRLLQVKVVKISVRLSANYKEN